MINEVFAKELEECFQKQIADFNKNINLTKDEIALLRYFYLRGVEKGLNKAIQVKVTI